MTYWRQPDDPDMRAGCRAWIITLAMVIVALAIVRCSSASAHDHEHPELDSWYMGLHAKGGAWCCDGQDAVTVDEWESANGHYRALVENEWTDIPDEAIVEGPNRAGQAKIWLKHLDGHPQARCFIPGAFG